MKEGKGITFNCEHVMKLVKTLTNIELMPDGFHAETHGMTGRILDPHFLYLQRYESL